MIEASIKTLMVWRASLSADEKMMHSRMVNGRQRVYMDLPLKHRRRYQAMLAAAPGLPEP